jgi:dTDP-4-dehydrorhamnose 3,5-epimerase
MADIEGVVVKRLERHEDGRGWLAELFRTDELAEAFRPVMAYASVTEPGQGRGPHEHVDQADLFCFVSQSAFRLYLWDNRPDSASYRQRMRIDIPPDEPMSVLVPAGVVHAYRNVGDTDGLVFNAPNRLYRGRGRSEPVDEIRHEDDPDSPFIIED